MAALGQPVRASRGFFVAGKFDQHQRDIPDSTFVQAFTELVLEIRVEPAAPRLARLSVKDSGIGIPAERLPHVFERFERAVSTREYGGLGLGLYISRRIIEGLGGSITAETAPA